MIIFAFQKDICSSLGDVGVQMVSRKSRSCMLLGRGVFRTSLFTLSELGFLLLLGLEVKLGKT